jgi:hypothetical protein
MKQTATHALVFAMYIIAALALDALLFGVPQ